MKPHLILNATVVNEGNLLEQDVLLKNGKIERVGTDLQHCDAGDIIDASGLYLIPGMIDDQVHFREPGLTHKADIKTESAAAVAGGITSFMEMPNVSPPTTNTEALENKFGLAAKNSLANYSFYIGATNTNIRDVVSIDTRAVCGIKVFMGASTGNLLVDDPKALEKIFNLAPTLVATHCEDNHTISKNLRAAKKKFGEDIPVSQHPVIRSEEACFLSSSFAVDLAKNNNTELHVLHISTEKELSLFSSQPLKSKKITAEACVHHLWFNDDGYSSHGSLIKCNPAIKKESDRKALIEAVNLGLIDIIATDHAPHTRKEKDERYSESPAGIPLVQHALLSLLDHFHEDTFSLETIIEKVCHNPASRFHVKDRGYIREGYAGDIVLLDLTKGTTVTKGNIAYKCGWSPFEGHDFKSKICATYVNGELVFDGEKIVSDIGNAMALKFDR
ncbi:MAG: dihydroorotase [Pseudomonadota bacterium]|nr:dihydroorotase [Pseudomonadota bacterium]